MPPTKMSGMTNATTQLYSGLRDIHYATHSGAEIRKLTSLLDMSQALSGTLKLRTHRIVSSRSSRSTTRWSAVRFTSRHRGRVFRVEAALGLGRGRKPPGEGVAERVAESGKSVVVPQASLEPSVPSPIKKGRGPVGDVTIISVPVSVDRKPVGALTVELPFKRDRDYDRSKEPMGVVASLVAQAIKLNRLVEAERSRLIQENRLLREELRGKYDFSNIVGNSGPMRQVYEQVAQSHERHHRSHPRRNRHRQGTDRPRPA